MSQSARKSLPFKFFILATLFFCLPLLLSRNTNFFSLAVTQQQDNKLPEVLVATQPESPLIISPLRVEAPEPYIYEILYNLTNIGKKPIRAYTIRQVMFVGGQEQEAATWVDLDLTNKMLQPNQSIPEGAVFQPFSKQTPSNFTLSVDFIEFADGTTWGADLIKSAERMAGRRAGARESVKHLNKIFKEGGASAVMKALDSGALDFPPPAGHSAEWNDAFNDGKKMTKSRLKRAMNKGGLHQVERALLENLF